VVHPLQELELAPRAAYELLPASGAGWAVIEPEAPPDGAGVRQDGIEVLEALSLP
jgi:hypothetical protein